MGACVEGLTDAVPRVEEETGKEKKRGEMVICVDGGPRSRPKEAPMNRDERAKRRLGGVHRWGT